MAAGSVDIRRGLNAVSSVRGPPPTPPPDFDNESFWALPFGFWFAVILHGEATTLVLDLVRVIGWLATQLCFGWQDGDVSGQHGPHSEAGAPPRTTPRSCLRDNKVQWKSRPHGERPHLPRERRLPSQRKTRMLTRRVVLLLA